MPRIEIEFEFDMVFCLGICLAPYAVFSTRICLQHIARPVESGRPINIVVITTIPILGNPGVTQYILTSFFTCECKY